MTIFLTTLHIVVCFTLVLVILLQAGRGQGLGGASFGGSNVQSVLGTRAGDFMTKATTVAAIAFLATSIGLDLLEVRKSRSLLDGLRPESSIDVNAIQKALEKIKQESEETAAVQDETGEIVQEVAETTSVEEATIQEVDEETIPVTEDLNDSLPPST